MRLLFCRIFGHRRSKRRARPFADQWRSRCTRCDTNLVRLASGHWQVTDGESFPEPPTALPFAHLNDLEPVRLQPERQTSAPRKPRPARHVHWCPSGNELRIGLGDLDRLADRDLANRQPIKLQAVREVQIGIFIGRLDDEAESSAG